MSTRTNALLALGFAVATSHAQLVAYHQSATGGAGLNLIKPNIRIENQGAAPVDLSKLTIDYLVQEDGTNPSSLVAECWYSSATTCSDVTAEFAVITPRQEDGKKANLRIRIGFRTGLLGAGQNLTLQWGLHEQGWLRKFDESDDWSFTTGDGQWHAAPRIGINVGTAAPEAPAMVWKGEQEVLPDPVSFNAGDVVRERSSGSSYILDKGAWVVLAEAGKTGPQGVQGPKGDAGVAGPQGPEGVAGPMGPAGPQGVAGPQGAAGDVGPMGPVGPKGDVGATGPQGAEGLQGPKGDAGGLDPAALARIEALEALVAKLSTGTIVNEKWLTDGRDGKVYRIVRIGNQNWMAENLNYAGEDGRLGACWKGDPNNCAKNGRLYSWTMLMGIDPLYQNEMWGGSDIEHQGICPAGWHVPNDAEWDDLLSEAASLAGAGGEGTALKATWGWLDPKWIGTDLFGFAVRGVMGSMRDGVGSEASYWSATEYVRLPGQSNEAIHRDFLGSQAGVYRGYLVKRIDRMARCVQDRR